MSSRIMRAMRIGCDVQLHTVLGVSHPLSLAGGPSDGVVLVTSARHPGVDSELAVAAKHVQVHRHPATSAEVWRILQEHLHSLDAAPDGATTPPSPSSSPDG